MLILPYMARAGMESDSIRHEVSLTDVKVRGHRAAITLRGDFGATVLDMGMTGRMPQIMGNADPVRMTQLLAGVQTNSEYDAGMYIDGCDNSHNDITLNGVTVYNAQHLFGFFSTFNPGHFKRLTLKRNANNAADANRLGGFLDMATADTLCHVWHAALAVGPMSSQGTLHLPAGKHSALTVSARAAYMNLLYSKWLKHDGEQYRYYFSDYNINYLWTPTDKDRIWIDAYYGNDDVSTDNKGHAYDVKLVWENALAAIHWKRQTGQRILYQRLFTTTYHSRPRVLTPEYSLYMPSSVRDWGYHCELTDSCTSAGIDVTLHSIQAQSPDASGSTFSVTLSPQPKKHTTEISVYGNRDIPLYRDWLTLRGGLRLSTYHGGGKWQYGADPLLAMRLKPHNDGEIRFTTNIKHQYIIRTGFTSLGLPSEFWMSTGKDYHAQYGWNTSLAYETMFLNHKWRFSIEVYHKRLWRQVEFTGTLFDMLYGEYSLDKQLAVGKGRNYGVNIQLEKRLGILTGWIAYSLGRAMRTFHSAALNGTFPANHERIHEINQVMAWNIGRKWKLTETLVFASGTPFTAPEGFYMIGQNIVANFSKHNEYRLRPYFRMDLSSSYTLYKNKNMESGINLSLYNVTTHNNDIYYRLKFKEDKVAYRPVRFAVPILPSISFYLTF